MLCKLLIVFVLLMALVIPALTQAAPASLPLFGATCLKQDPGVAQVARVVADGMVAWNAKGEPIAFRLGIVDTTSRTFIRRLLALAGRPTWIGYKEGGWDVEAQVLALHSYRKYRLYDAAGDPEGIGRYVLTMALPPGDEVYINVYTRFNYLNQTGTPVGNHPCNSIAVPLRIIQRLESE